MEAAAVLSRAIEGSQVNVQNAINSARTAALNAGFSGLYIVGDSLWWDQGGVDTTTLAKVLPDAVTAFAPADPTEGVSENDNNLPTRTWANKMASEIYSPALTSIPNANLQGIDLNPGIFTQYDNRGFDDSDCLNPPVASHKWHLTSKSDFGYMIDVAGKPFRYVARVHRISANCTETITTNIGLKTILWVYGYNEWGEGAGMEQLKTKNPRYPYGFGIDLLDKLRTKLP